MLDALRKSTKSWVIKILFALLILSFAVWGVGDMVRINVASSPAITVGDVEIPATQVAQEFNRQVRQLQAALGGAIDADQARQLGLLENTIDGMVVRALLDQAADDLGLMADDDALRRSIAAVPAFRNQLGQFDPNTFRQALASAGLSEQAFLAMERRNLVRGQIVEALSGGISPPEAMVAPVFAYRQEDRTAEIIRLRADKVTAPPPPDETGLRQYYEKNSSRFMAPEYRGVTVLQIRPSDVAGEITINDEMVAEAYEQRINEFQDSERRNVQQILFENEEQAKRAGEMRKDGKDFATIARSVGNKPLEIINLGWVEKSSLLPEMAEVIFSLPAKSVSEPFKSPLGWHMFNLVEAMPGKTRPLEEVKDQLKQDLVNEKAIDHLYELANKVDDALASGASMEETARELNLKAEKIEAIDPQGMTPKGEPAPAAPQSETFRSVAFSTPQGSESQLTEMDGNAYFVVRVDSVTPPALKPFEAVRDEVAAAWQAERRQAIAEEQAKAAAERLGQGEPAEKVAASFGAEAATTEPFTREGTTARDLPPELIGKLFQATVGQAAHAAAGAGGGAIAARLVSIDPADPKEDAAALEQLRQQVGQALSGDLVDQYVASLRGKYRVSINRKIIEDQFDR